MLATAVFGLPFLTSPAQATFEDNDAGARPRGMGEAFVAVADDVNALSYNPAGLPQVGNALVTAQYGQMLSGLSDSSSIQNNFVGYVQPFHSGRWGSMGFAIHNFKGSTYFSDRMVQLGYGFNLRPHAFGWEGRWSVGASLKQFHRQFEPNPYTQNALNDVGVGSGQADPLFSKNGYSATAYAADIGGLYRFGANERTSLGASVANLNQPDISIGGDKDRVPLVARMGLAYRPNWALLSVEARRTKRLSSASDTDTAFGIERRFSLAKLGAFSIRGGYAQGSREFKLITAGASFQLSNIWLDYAFDFPIGNLADQGSHRVAVSFRLGSPRPDDSHTEEVRFSKTETLPELNARLTPAESTPHDSSLADPLGHYLARKTAGASMAERLHLLQNLYIDNKVDSSFMAKELSSL